MEANPSRGLICHQDEHLKVAPREQPCLQPGRGNGLQNVGMFTGIYPAGSVPVPRSPGIRHGPFSLTCRLVRSVTRANRLDCLTEERISCHPILRSQGQKPACKGGRSQLTQRAEASLQRRAEASLQRGAEWVRRQRMDRDVGLFVGSL